MNLCSKGMQMVVRKTLGAYVATDYVWDYCDRKPWEIAVGASYYPNKSRAWRINLHMIHVVRSSTGSYFGYYTPGQTGTTSRSRRTS